MFLIYVFLMRKEIQLRVDQSEISDILILHQDEQTVERIMMITKKTNEEGYSELLRSQTGEHLFRLRRGTVAVELGDQVLETNEDKEGRDVFGFNLWNEVQTVRPRKNKDHG